MINQAYLGLGSNLGDSIEQVLLAIESFRNHSKINQLIASSLYCTKPHGGILQQDFINAVIGIQTPLTPKELLFECQALENKHQRQRIVRYGPRTLDVDILLFNESHINCDSLTIPHPRIKEREFVVIPLLEIAPELTLPCGMKLKDITTITPDNVAVVKHSHSRYSTTLPITG